MDVRVKASFKQATVKGGTAVVQMEVLTCAAGFYDLMRLAGQNVVLNVEGKQSELDLEPEMPQGEPLPLDVEDDWQEDGVEPAKPANVDIETGEIYPEITDEGRMLSDGEVE